MLTRLPQPVSPQILIRTLVVLLVILAFAAGYYHSLWQTEVMKNEQLLLPVQEVTLGEPQV